MSRCIQREYHQAENRKLMLQIINKLEELNSRLQEKN